MNLGVLCIIFCVLAVILGTLCVVYINKYLDLCDDFNNLSAKYVEIGVKYDLLKKDHDGLTKRHETNVDFTKYLEKKVSDLQGKLKDAENSAQSKNTHVIEVERPDIDSLYSKITLPIDYKVSDAVVKDTLLKDILSKEISEYVEFVDNVDIRTCEKKIVARLRVVRPLMKKEDLSDGSRYL